MSLNLGTVEDAWLEGSLNFEEFMEEFDMNFFAPLGQFLLSALSQSFTTLPPLVRAEIERLAPGALDEIEVLGGEKWR